MVLINFLFFISNLLLLIFGFYFIKKKTEKLVINKEILNDIKKEINSMIVKLNETTVNNITIIEDKAKNLEKLLKLADRKSGGLDKKIFENNEEPENFNLRFDNLTYSPQKIVKQSNETTEKIYKEEKIREKEFLELDEKVKDFSINEKVRFMLNEGFTTDEIKKKFGLSSVEFELILNIEIFENRGQSIEFMA